MSNTLSNTLSGLVSNQSKVINVVSGLVQTSINQDDINTLYNELEQLSSSFGQEVVESIQNTYAEEILTSEY